MYCSKCGAANADTARFCAGCGGSLAPAVVSSPVVVYAGFWLRYLALIIDGMIATPVILILLLPFGLAGVLTAVIGKAVDDPESIPMAVGGLWVFIGAAIALSVVGNWLYHAVMESSSFQATFGKKILGMVVTDLAGQRISFAQATGRHFGKLLSGLIMNIGFIMAAFTEKKQALHDMLAGCLVVRR
ncbi:MAG: RDD family protein [Candidatus Solibacter usitatus]|nr:RDD family protein [Candidatus Solibacter usitatus]